MSGSFHLPAIAVAGNDSLAAAFLAGASIESGADPALSYPFRAQLRRLRGDTARARSLEDSARVVLERKIRELPDDYGFHADLGEVYAHLGRGADAIREGTRAVALLPPSRDAYFGVNNVESLARIYSLLGQAAPAVAQLRTIWGLPGAPTAGRLRVEPAWQKIRNDPAFQQLLSGTP